MDKLMEMAKALDQAIIEEVKRRQEATTGLESNNVQHLLAARTGVQEAINDMLLVK